MRLIRSFALAAAFVGTLGCGSEYYEGPTGPVDPATDTYASSRGIDISTFTKTTSGVYYKDLLVGTGATAAENDSLRIHYTGLLTGGQTFDSSRGGSPLEAKLRKATPTTSGFIVGFVDGISGMKVGGRRKFIIPAALAYGQQGLAAAGIPRYANLVFDVELLAKL
jgi:FKBP-type peptidyl-prolyl cis-trans isomerase FkpA